MAKRLFFILPLVNLFVFSVLNAQDVDQLGRDSPRVITTAVPFLTISPDARAGAMGDVGVATSPDANAIHWNPAKLAFMENDLGFSISYTPWLRKLVNDMSLSYLTGYKKLSKEEAIGFSLLYFNLGSITFTDINGATIRDFDPREFAISSTYSRKLSENLGVALGLKFIHSNLSGNLAIDQAGTIAKAGNTAAGDIGLFWNNDYIINGTNTNIAFGATISNIGAKISYTNTNQKDFIPTNLRLGTAITAELDPYNKFVFAFDFNKLLVPTTPVYYKGENGRDSLDDNRNRVIARGRNPDRPLLSGMFGSFGDAPDGFREEMREIMMATGVEYWYNDLFAARGGYFHESALKGNRKYFTLGFGIRYQVFGLDFAYLIPIRTNNPLAETLRFTLLFNFESKGRPQMESITN